MSTVYLARSAWTPTARGGATLTGGSLVGLAIHYPGRVAPYGVLSQAQEAAILRGIRDWSVGTKGYSDIDYQTCFTQAGRVWDLRGIARVPAAHGSAANPTANHQYGALLVMIGNSEQPSPALIEAIRHFRSNVWLPRWPGRTNVRDHSQVPGANTSCAGPRVRALISSGAFTTGPAPAPQPPSKGDNDMPLNDADKKWLRENCGQQRVNPTLGMQYGTMSRLVFNAVRPDRSQAPGARVGFLADLDRIAEQNTAILAATAGQDVLAAIEAHAEQARQHRVQVADALETRLEAAEVERAELAELVGQVASGEREASEVVRLIGQRLVAGQPEG